MAGVVLETLNTKKLIAFGISIFIAHAAFFLIGGLISPAPNTNEQIIMSKCVDRTISSNRSNKWFFLRPFSSDHSCKDVIPDGELSQVAPNDIEADQIVFVAQFPLPRSGFDLQMTRWFQQVFAVLMLDIKYENELQVKKEATLTFDVRLGYRNRGDADQDWKEIAHSYETRPLKCKIDPNALKDKVHSAQTDSGYYYDCEVLPLFTLGNCHYDSYLVNIRIPVDNRSMINTDIGWLQDVWMIEIHQNGGFTKVWFSLKTALFPITLAALVFFWRRVAELSRSPTLMEQTIFSLGIVLNFFNCPVEWLSLKYNLSFWLVLSDLRQGIFYAALACFWLIFTGEHLMDTSHGPKKHRSDPAFWGISRYYWPKLILVGGCCSALSIFELAERGVQLHNPFYSIWSHPSAARIGYASVVIGGICASIYFLYLAYILISAVWQIFSKRRLLPSLASGQRLYYSGLIYRFTALLFYTIICAALTVVFFIFSQANEEQWKWGSRSIEYSSAFVTGVYGMWNSYVITILCLYAPSHKFRSVNGQQLLEKLIVSDATVSESVHCRPSSVETREKDSAKQVEVRSGASAVKKEIIELCSITSSPSVSGLSYLKKTTQD